MPSAMHMQRCNELTWEVSGISLPTSLSLPCPRLGQLHVIVPFHPRIHRLSLTTLRYLRDPVATLRLETTTGQTLWLQSTRIVIPLLSVLVLRDTTGCHVGSRWLMANQICLYLCHRVELPAHEHCAAGQLRDTASQPSALGGLDCNGLGLKQQPTMSTGQQLNTTASAFGPQHVLNSACRGSALSFQLESARALSNLEVRGSNTALEARSFITIPPSTHPWMCKH